MELWRKIEIIAEVGIFICMAIQLVLYASRQRHAKQAKLVAAPPEETLSERVFIIVGALTAGTAFVIAGMLVLFMVVGLGWLILYG